jgi:hypothetical protein
MDRNDSRDGYPGHDSGSDRPALGHRISSILDISSQDLSHGGHRDSVISLPSPSSEGPRFRSEEESDISHVRLSSAGSSSVTSPIDRSSRHSRLSMLLPGTLRVGSPTSPSSRGFNPFSRTANTSYEPLEGSSRSSSSNRTGSKRFSATRKSSFLAIQKHGSIPEEIDMSLLESSMPMGFSKQNTTYVTDAGDAREDAPMVSPENGTFDISTFTGPMSPQSEAQLRELNRQEASGILTGGLGVGLKPETTISSSDLYANAPQIPISPAPVTHRMSFRKTGLVRAPTLRDLGQHEANKRGEIIQVIMEEEPRAQEEPPVDISSVAGGNTTNVVGDFDQIDGKQSRKNTILPANVEVFYPQANWKPYSMRWPYLTALVAISVTLAAAQEYLLQKSNRGPLFEFRSAQKLKTWDYFTFKYLPTLVGVSFGVLWQITDFEVKRLEAYYQLSKEGGALAAESINVDYITFFNFLRPVRALKYKHYAVAVSSMATLIAVSLVPTLQASSVKLTPDRITRDQNPLGLKQIHIDAVYSRLLSVILILIAILGCVLAWQLQRRKSGLVADVKGIAGIAAMANRSHILMDFKNMDTATPEMIHQKLKAHRYTLRNSSLAPEENIPLTQEDKDKYDQQRRHENPHPLMLRLIAGVPFVVGMILFTVLVPIILFQQNANILTDKAPWFLTILAVCIKVVWGTLETDVRMIEPFYILSRRHASPKVLTLDYTAMVFGYMPIRAFLNGHFLVGLVGLGSVLAEVLTVCAASFGNVSGYDFTHPDSPPPQMSIRQALPDVGTGVDAGEETIHSFWASFGLAITILTFLCSVATIVYYRRRHPFLPRQPNTIGSILAFIHQSKMLYDFVGTEKMNNDEMVERLAKIGKKYGLGWFTGRDGEVHCGVDEEELLSNYKHGDDARKASMPWTTNWQDY